MTGAQEYQASKDQQIAQLQSDFGATQKQLQEALAQAQVTQGELTKRVEALGQQNQALTARLGQTKLNPTDAAIRQADGQVLRIPGDGTVYINLGSGDQISRGLTFEVYDRLEGIPAAYRGIGVRVEDDVIVTSDGSEILSTGVPRNADEVLEHRGRA